MFIMLVDLVLVLERESCSEKRKGLEEEIPGVVSEEVSV